MYINPIVNNSVLTPDASEALDELGPFLALVCDYLQRGSKFLVVVSEPLQQWHALDQLMFLPRLGTQPESDRNTGSNLTFIAEICLYSPPCL